jgi:hypothetical protein
MKMHGILHRLFLTTIVGNDDEGRRDDDEGGPSSEDIEQPRLDEKMICKTNNQHGPWITRRFRESLKPLSSNLVIGMSSVAQFDMLVKAKSVGNI